MKISVGYFDKKGQAIHECYERLENGKIINKKVKIVKRTSYKGIILGFHPRDMVS